MEQFKDIIGYEGLYQISNLGNIKSLSRLIKNDKSYYKIEEKILANFLDKHTGYYKVNLWKNNKGKKYFIHRLIAEHFIDNPKNKEEVNHINGIKTDYRICNLEWVIPSENGKHAYKNGLNTVSEKGLEALSKYNKTKQDKVFQYDKQNNFIKEYESQAEAIRITGIKHINCVCKGRRKTADGFIWKNLL